MQDNNQTSVFSARFSIIVISALVTALTTLELAVAFEHESTQTLVREAMWTGSLFWAAVTVIGWKEALEDWNKKSFWLAIFITFLAAGSFAGLFIPSFMTFALWANALLCALILIVAVFVFPRAWR
jgi:hypothetical protein